MNIKSLLLGSAVAMVAATGARAADVVIAEPEPVEYVRICDAYGAGFFYIPGTETCLSISGYVWWQVAAGDYTRHHTAGPAVIGDTTGYYDVTPGNAWMPSTRARVNFDARSDTEWGTLRGFIRIQGTWNGSAVGDGPATFDQAFIELGGLRMGYSESAWAQTQGGGASNWGSHSWGGMYYGYQQRFLIAYTFQGGNGFFGTLSLEDDAGAGSGYTPDVVVKIGVNQGWGAVWVMGAYDESFSGSGYGPFSGPVGIPGAPNSGGFAAALGLQINVPNMPGSSFRLIGFYADGDHAYGAGAPSTLAFAPIFGPIAVPMYGSAEWSILASYNHAFSSTFSASVAFQWFNDLYYAGTDVSSGVDAWGAEVSVVWFPVTNFEVRAEIHYDDVGAHRAPLPAPFAGANPPGTTSGFLRFTRYF